MAYQSAASSSRKDCYSYSQRVHCHVPFMEAVEAKARRRHVPLAKRLLQRSYVLFLFARQPTRMKFFTIAVDGLKQTFGQERAQIRYVTSPSHLRRQTGSHT